VISFSNVQKSYPEFDMSIDFSINEGELVSILGPSGSGKTTTLRLIAGFEQPDSGVISINGRDVTGMSPAERQIGYVFQDYTLFPHMTVGDNVGYGLRVRRRPAEEIADTVRSLLEMVDLPGYEHREVTTLSGGERQRVAIARALAVDPVLLLLDEPFSSIDEVLRRDLRDEIVRLQTRLGITVVFVTHSRQEALAISDRVAVLNEGKIVQFDEVERLYREPRDRFVAAFVGEANFLPLPGNGAADTAGGPKVAPAGDDPGDLPVGGPSYDSGITADSPDRAALLLRPEQLHLLTPEDAAGLSSRRSIPEDTVHLDGTIDSHQFLGSTHRYTCRTAAGTLIVEDPRRLEVGIAVVVAYRPADGYPIEG
jgi:ABC-type Fe3+/spermidine/putrescine transport system ATPase subunit